MNIRQNPETANAPHPEEPGLTGVLKGTNPGARNGLTRRVTEARPADAGRGIARMDPADLAALGISVGDLVAIAGGNTAFARALPLAPEHRGQGRISIDGLLRQNSRASVGDDVLVSAALAQAATRLTLTFDGEAQNTPAFQRQVRQALADIPLALGCKIRLRLIGGQELGGTVSVVAPDGPCFLVDTTALAIAAAKTAGAPHSISYEDLGGLHKELARVREVVELPIRRPDLFKRLGIEAPKGVLLSGPPGTGKTLLARAVSEECGAAFFQINGPEIIGKHYGESEEALRAIFKRASEKAPAIVFIDEIDAIAPKREGLTGDKQVERRIVAQLLTLLDGLKGRGQVIVIAATNMPDSLDPALRRPGRFDREIIIGVPDRMGRREIIDVHTRGMPLSPDVDLGHMASITHGYVGADLAALAREAGMATLRRALAIASHDDAADFSELSVNQADFDSAFADIRPSGLREAYTDIPNVRWDEIGGLDSIRDELIEAVIWPLTKPQVFTRLGLQPPKGLLLSGSPGTGKTLLAKALATEAKVNVIAVRGPQLLNQYVGESERAVRQIFAKARQASPCIIFFDEIDALAPRRGGAEGAVLDRVVAQLLVEIDGMEDLKGVFLLGATNRVDCIDPALIRPGRFDRVIEMPPPDRAARERILSIHVRAMPLGEDVDLAAIAAATPAFVGADLRALCQAAARHAARRSIAASANAALIDVVETRDFDAALASMHSERALRAAEHPKDKQP